MIICAGMPRCGTTMMFGALAGIKIGGTMPRDYEGDIRKTHTFHPSRFVNARKAIFMFGDPVTSIVPTVRTRMTPGHFKLCGAGHIDPAKADIFSADILNYERMFTSWMRRQPFDLIGVRYETLHDNLKLVSAFFDDRHLYIKPRASSDESGNRCVGQGVVSNKDDLCLADRKGRSGTGHRHLPRRTRLMTSPALVCVLGPVPSGR